MKRGTLNVKTSMARGAQLALFLGLMYVRPFVSIGAIGVLLESNGPSNFSNTEMDELICKV